MMDKRTKCQAIAPACWEVVYLNVLQQAQKNNVHVGSYSPVMLLDFQ
jgi:hypothetical protein